MADSTASQSRTVTPEDQDDVLDMRDQVKSQADDELEMGSDGTDDDDENQFYERTYIWYAATVFPLSAACFGPMASVFNICALAEDWRVYIPPGGTEAQEIAITDPTWYYFSPTLVICH
jgi:hypothetical protein